MTIGVIKVHLLWPVRPRFRAIHDFDTGLMQHFDREINVVDLKSKMMTSGCLCNLSVRPASQTGVLIRQRDMNLRCPGLEPGTGETESGARDFVHPKQVDVKFTRRFDVSNDQSDVVDRRNLDRFRVCHVQKYTQNCPKLTRTKPESVAPNSKMLLRQTRCPF